MEAFRKDNLIINIKKYPTEPEEHFQERCLFITSQQLCTENDLIKPSLTHGYTLITNTLIVNIQKILWMN